MGYRKNTKQIKPKGRFRKRWYIDARVGKNVPIIGGSGIRLGTRGVKKIVRREISRAEETKIFATNDLKSTGLLMNTLYTLSPLTITGGTGSNQRIGKDIYLRHLKVRLAIQNTTTQNQVQYRVMVLWSDSQYILDWTTYAGVGIGSSDIFYGSNNYTGALIDNKRNVKIICDKLYTVTAPVSGTLVKKNFSFDCPLFQKVTFINAANNILKDMQLYVVVIPTTPAGTSGVTAVGDFSAQALLTYKDA